MLSNTLEFDYGKPTFSISEEDNLLRNIGAVHAQPQQNSKP